MFNNIEMGGGPSELGSLEINPMNGDRPIDLPSEFFSKQGEDILSLSDSARSTLESSIMNLESVLDDPETRGWLQNSEQELNTLDAESVNVLEQTDREVKSLSGKDEKIDVTGPEISSIDALRQELAKRNESSYEGKIDKFKKQHQEVDSINETLSSTAEAKVVENKPENDPKITLKKAERLDYEKQKTLEGQFEQRQRSLEVQRLIRLGHDPDMIGRNTTELLENNSYNRSLVKAFETYRTSNDTIDKYREDNIDPHELYKSLFGFVPKGEVSIDYGSIDIAFLFEDPADYARAIYKEDVVDPNLLDHIKSHGGCVLKGGSLPKELDGKIILIPKASKEVVETLGDSLKHERQHVLNNLYEDSRYHDLGKMTTIKDVEASTKESKKDTILAYLGYERRRVDNDKVHDELLAHYKGLDLRSKNEIGKKVVANLVISYREGFYNYQKGKCRQALEKIGTNPALIEDCITESFTNESWKEISDAAYCLKDLENAGLSKDEVIDLVQMEPLARWPEVAKQFIEKYKKMPRPDAVK